MVCRFCKFFNIPFGRLKFSASPREIYEFNNHSLHKISVKRASSKAMYGIQSFRDIPEYVLDYFYFSATRHVQTRLISEDPENMGEQSA